jgi:hypothetical protein
MEMIARAATSIVIIGDHTEGFGLEVGLRQYLELGIGVAREETLGGVMIPFPYPFAINPTILSPIKEPIRDQNRVYLLENRRQICLGHMEQTVDGIDGRERVGGEVLIKFVKGDNLRI